MNELVCFRVSPNPGMLQLAAVPGPSSATEPWQMFTQEVVLTFLVVLCYFVARGQVKAPAVGAAYLATTLTSSVRNIDLFIIAKLTNFISI